MLVPQTLIHDIFSQLWDTNHPVGSLIIRSVLHDLIDQQRKKKRNIHKVLITGLHNFRLPYPQFTQVGHIYTQSLLPQWNMNEHSGGSLLLTLPWANAIGKAFLWLLSIQHTSSQEPIPFQVCYTKWKCWIWGGRGTTQTQIHESKACWHRGGEYTHTP